MKAKRTSCAFRSTLPGNQREIAIGGNRRPAPNVEAGGIREGKLLLGLQPADSWFIAPGVIDLGAAHRIPIDVLGDTMTMARTEDGRIVASVVGLRSSLWKFRAEVR